MLITNLKYKNTKFPTNKPVIYEKEKIITLLLIITTINKNKNLQIFTKNSKSPKNPTLKTFILTKKTPLLIKIIINNSLKI
jgi:hypothetical protein